ncbi:MAG: hypothetical protein JXB32_07210 [Deltaproteobacteria bacterium]|nr:hypothetical protein [Deltaproteobacteria bacterium]
MTKVLDTVLLLALPASGKSEVRKYLALQTPEKCRDDFGLGETVQLDDFPYVHLMRRVDDELAALGKERIFFQAPDRGFREGRDWGTLIELINEDREALDVPAPPRKKGAGETIMMRLEQAAMKVGIPPRLSKLDGATRAAVAGKLEKESRELLDGLVTARPASLEGKTIIIEAARGGAEGSAMPLAAPFGYLYSLGLLSPKILERASILYIWVTPEESRRKNLARTDPNDPGSILHHGVPEAVMRGDYGCDDMGWLIEQSDKPNTVRVEAHGRTYHLPVARFDNRVDRTSFVRGDVKTWKPEDVKALHEGLREAFALLKR